MLAISFVSFPHSDVKLGSYTGDPDSAQTSLGLNFELPFKPLLALCMGLDQRYWRVVSENSSLLWVFVWLIKLQYSLLQLLVSGQKKPTQDRKINAVLWQVKDRHVLLDLTKGNWCLMLIHPLVSLCSWPPKSPAVIKIQCNFFLSVYFKFKWVLWASCETDGFHMHACLWKHLKCKRVR